MTRRGRGPSNDWLVALYGWGIGAIVLAMIVFAITLLVGGCATNRYAALYERCLESGRDAFACKQAVHEQQARDAQVFHMRMRVLFPEGW